MRVAPKDFSLGALANPHEEISTLRLFRTKMAADPEVVAEPQDASAERFAWHLDRLVSVAQVVEREAKNVEVAEPLLPICRMDG